MPDPLEPPQRGRPSPFLTSFDTTNQTIETINDVRRRGFGRGVGPPPVQDLRPVRVYVQNNSGADKDALDVLALSGIVNSIEDADSGALTWIRQPTFSGTTPAATTDAFCILEEPAQYVAGGESPLAKGVIFGVVPVDVNVTDEAHDYATPTAGDATKLTSAESGPARILYKPSGTGTKRCVVRLDESAAGSAGTTVDHGVQAGSTSVYTITTSGVWEDTGHNITLPSAGDYLLFATMSGLAEISATPPGYISFRLSDATAGVVIRPTLYAVNCAVAPVTGVQFIGSGSLSDIYTSPGANQIKVQAARGSGPTWTNSQILGSSFARTMGYLKLS